MGRGGEEEGKERKQVGRAEWHAIHTAPPAAAATAVSQQPERPVRTPAVRPPITFTLLSPLAATHTAAGGYPTRLHFL